jgi:hypothetical protein
MDKKKWTDILIEGLILGACQAVILVLLLLALTAALGNSQATQVKYSQATACELAIPATDKGRDPRLVSECFLKVGLAPPDFVNP